MLTVKQRRKCAKCGHSSSGSVRSFHRIPTPGGTNIEKCRKWATWLHPDENWESDEKLQQLAKKSRVICSAHFKESDYTDHARRLLRRAAVPHVSLPTEGSSAVPEQSTKLFPHNQQMICQEVDLPSQHSSPSTPLEHLVPDVMNSAALIGEGPQSDSISSDTHK